MVNFERFVDKYLGFFIILFLYPLKLLEGENKPNKFLIIKFWAIGDSVLVLSLIKAVKTLYKDATVNVLTRKRILPVYESYDKIDKIILWDDITSFVTLIFNIRKYDVVFDCEPYMNLSALYSFWVGKLRVGFAKQWKSKLYSKTVMFNKKQHMLQNYLDMVRVLGNKYDANMLESLSSSNKSKKIVDLFLEKNVKKKTIVGITPGVAESVKSRMWPEKRFAKLADKMIKELYVEVLFIDGPSNKHITEKIIKLMGKKPVNCVGKFNLDETFHLIKKCNIFISNDTGPMHIAATQGCKTIGLFGPNTPVLWGPYGKDNIAIFKPKKGCPYLDNTKHNLIPRNLTIEQLTCMDAISVYDVFSAVKKLL